MRPVLCSSHAQADQKLSALNDLSRSGVRSNMLTPDALENLPQVTYRTIPRQHLCGPTNSLHASLTSCTRHSPASSNPLARGHNSKIMVSGLCGQLAESTRGCGAAVPHAPKIAALAPNNAAFHKSSGSMHAHRTNSARALASRNREQRPRPEKSQHSGPKGAA